MFVHYSWSLLGFLIIQKWTGSKCILEILVLINTLIFTGLFFSFLFHYFLKLLKTYCRTSEEKSYNERVKQWNKFPKDIVKSPTLEIFKTQLDNPRADGFHFDLALLWVGGWIIWHPELPSNLYFPIIIWKFNKGHIY